MGVGDRFSGESTGPVRWLICSCCGKTPHEGRRVIAGPGGNYICDECVALCNAGTMELSEMPHCSFCDKKREVVAKLFAGPSVSLCDECLKLCNEIIAEELSRPPG